MKKKYTDRNCIKVIAAAGIAAVLSVSSLMGISVSKVWAKEYVYCVGSVSKIYSTAAVMKLVDEGKVKLDGPVTDYIPDFKMADDRYKDITVRMLMDHTSGLMGTSRIGMLLYGDDNDLHMKNLLKTLSTQRLKADPGKYASYCNDGFDLLAIITENVSGKTFAEYVQEELASPTGGGRTLTGHTCFSTDDLVPAFSAGHNLYDQGVAMATGAGGVFATASDVARFGAGFFYGNDALLTDGSKREMAKCWNDTDEFMDGCGLGWDMVGDDKYKSAGVSVLGKGGDDGLNHAYLLVAPDEKISVAVLSNGGSSTLNGLVSQAILDACLEEKGITVSEAEKRRNRIIPEIPATYDEYAGSYIVASEAGETIDLISFPDHKYMHVENIGPYGRTCTDYALTEDKRFTELAYEVADSGIEDIRLAINPASVSFEKAENGKILIAGVRNTAFPEIGSYEKKNYVGEKMEDNPVKENVMSKWKDMGTCDVVLTNDIYSSENYDNAIAHIVQPECYPGYIFVISGMGTRLLKIVDEENAVAFQTIPSSRNRDLADLKIKKDEEGMKFILSDGCEYRLENDMREFNDSIKEVSLKTGRAVWYSIGSEAVNTEVTIEDRPKNSAVYVYNKFGEVVYTTHVKDMTNVLPMPEGGKLLFLGEDGGKIKII